MAGTLISGTANDEPILGGSGHDALEGGSGAFAVRLRRYAAPPGLSDGLGKRPY
ncbi:MAG TPA: hypothetical protein VD995_07460 [Azospirillum sp.]|nr:hypothetical protein [Azospirillum sp.]